MRTSDGRKFFAKTIVSNATRWDTSRRFRRLVSKQQYAHMHGLLLIHIYIQLHFLLGKLLKGKDLPKEEENFQKAYVKAPSFLSIHMGVKAEVLPPDTDCHHFVLEVFKLLSRFIFMEICRRLGLDCAS